LTVAATLPVHLLAVTIVLLAAPQRLGPPGQERTLTNIELLLDVSGSMAWPMGSAPAGTGPTRYKGAMEAVDVFTSRRRGDAFGLTIFGGDVVRWVPLTRDLSAIRSATPFVNPEGMPEQMRSTRLGRALRYVREVLVAEESGDRMIIMITDGEAQDLGNGEAGRIAAELADAHIVAYGINVGESVAPPQLFEVALPTGGQVYNAVDVRSLNSVFEHIDRMNPVRVRPTHPEPIDQFLPWAVAGLALLGAHALCLLGLRYTPW
jgi:Ca-activated chloride channel family protein